MEAMEAAGELTTPILLQAPGPQWCNRVARRLASWSIRSSRFLSGRGKPWCEFTYKQLVQSSLSNLSIENSSARNGEMSFTKSRRRSHTTAFSTRRREVSAVPALACPHVYVSNLSGASELPPVSERISLSPGFC